MAFNPYQAPESDLKTPITSANEEIELVLASRSARLLAALANGLLFAIAVFVPMLVTRALGSFGLPSENLRLLLVVTVVSICISIVIGNIVSIAFRGQTFGKRLLHIRIIQQNGNPLSITRYLFLRWMVFSGPIFLYIVILLIHAIMLIVPHAPKYSSNAILIPSLVSIILIIVTWPIDKIYIFGKSKRCLHDILSGTIVIKE